MIVTHVFARPTQEAPVLNGIAVHVGEFAAVVVIPKVPGKPRDLIAAYPNAGVSALRPESFVLATVPVAKKSTMVPPRDGATYPGEFPDPLVPMAMPFADSVKHVGWVIEFRPVTTGDYVVNFQSGTETAKLTVRALPARPPAKQFDTLVGVETGLWSEFCQFPMWGAKTAAYKDEVLRNNVAALHRYGIDAYNNAAGIPGPVIRDGVAVATDEWRNAVRGRPLLAWHCGTNQYKGLTTPAGGNWFGVEDENHKTPGMRNLIAWAKAMDSLYRSVNVTPYVFYDEPGWIDDAGKKHSIPYYEMVGNTPHALPFDKYPDERPRKVAQFILETAALLKQVVPTWRIGPMAPTAWYGPLFAEMGADFDLMCIADGDDQRSHGYSYEYGDMRFPSHKYQWVYHTDNTWTCIDSAFVDRTPADRWYLNRNDGMAFWSATYIQPKNVAHNPWNGIEQQWGNNGSAGWVYPATKDDKPNVFVSDVLPSMRLLHIGLAVQRIRQGLPPAFTSGPIVVDPPKEPSDKEKLEILWKDYLSRK